MKERVFTPGQLKLAVLIDADNVPYGSIEGIIEEIIKVQVLLPCQVHPAAPLTVS